MKELSIEEKAKRYDEAIKLAKDSFNYPDYPGFIRADVVFPELAENKDEKIRKDIISYLALYKDAIGEEYESWIAWLEMQGEHANFRNEIQVGDKVTRNEDGVLVNLNQLKRVAKPADKVEPKIKASDWVVCNNGPHHIFQVIERSWPNAKYRDLNGTEIFLNVNTLDKQYHLWTIQDAKDGDVLAVEHIGRYKFPFIAIYKNYGLNFFNSYCSIGFDGKFYEADTEHVLDDIHPATKEQRETLLKAMHEAGYEWDAEKKELKKVEQKPATWSEEDRDYYDAIIAKLEVTQDDALLTDNQMEFLKSLKDRYTWKPSNEQMEGIECTIKTLRYQLNAGDNRLDSLYNDLKKLRGELL